MKLAVWEQTCNNFFVRFIRLHHILLDDKPLCGAYNKQTGIEDQVIIRDNYYAGYDIVPFTQENFDFTRSQTDDWGRGLCKRCETIFNKKYKV